MTPVAAPERPCLFDRAADPAPARPRGGGLPLGRRLDEILDGARAGAVSECPLCGGRMVRAGHGTACEDCGSALS